MQAQNIDENMVVKCGGFSIIPSKIILTMIENKKKQYKAENICKHKIERENKLLDQLHDKNSELNELRNHLRSIKPVSESMTLTINQGIHFESLLK